MIAKRLLTTLVALGFAMAPAFAQAPATGTTPPPPPNSPVTPRAPAPAPAPATATAPAPKPAPAATAPAAAAHKVNLNTATEKELDGLPEVGKARAKVIMDERAKSRFKDWADFEKRMTGTSVNAGVKAKIKDLVVF